MVPADSARIPRVPAYSGAVSPGLGFSRTGLSPAAARLSSAVPLTLAHRFFDGPTTPRAAIRRPRFGLWRVRSPLLTLSLVCFLFLRVLRCFSSPGSPRTSSGGGIAPAGLPHSEIRASKGICPYARLIAACHVLRRLREPRHPSCALLSFPCTFISPDFTFYRYRGRPRLSSRPPLVWRR